jgi:hypothetical protein
MDTSGQTMERIQRCSAADPVAWTLVVDRFPITEASYAGSYAFGMTTRETAWDAVHEALPARWAVGPITFDPGAIRPDGLMGAFSVTARGPHPGRGKAPVTVSGTGEDETAALRDLDDRLRGVPKPNGTRLDELRRRLRFAYVDGAEEWTRQNVGRGLTRDELGGVIGRYVGR